MPAVASRKRGVFGTSADGIFLSAWLRSLSRCSGPTSCGCSPNVEIPAHPRISSPPSSPHLEAPRTWVYLLGPLLVGLDYGQAV
jgi:hypothetical protein